MSLPLIAIWSATLATAFAQPRDAQKDELYIQQLKNSAERIVISWAGKPLTEVPQKKISPCARQALTAIFSDRTEIMSAGTLVNNGQRIGTRHRFLYPLDPSVHRLSIQLSSAKEGRMHLTVEAIGDGNRRLGPPLFHGSVRENPCEHFPIDVIRWMELAGPAKPKVPTGEVNR